jgi:branched-chain amino acid transport system substrate-binding protein
MEDLTGRQFGHYQIVAPLGEGGMAAVYKAFQPSMERYVAIKVLPRHMSSSEEFVNRFRREARLLAQLQHPHILSVFDYGEADGYPYIVMPFVQSGTLSELLHKRQPTLLEVRRIMTQIGDALSYAHARGMIHRDIKPSNVLIDERGNCLLTDFGLARMAEASTKITTSGTVMGTPAYMSPEQGAGSNIDQRSDIYSLGIIFYEMVTGRVPYTAETPIAVVFKHIQDPLPSARKLNPSLTEAVELVLLKVLAKNPEDRYQTAEDLVQAIQRAIPERHLADENLPEKSLPDVPDLPTVIGPPISSSGKIAGELQPVADQKTIQSEVPVESRTVLAAGREPRRFPMWAVAGIGILVLAGVVIAVLPRMLNADNAAAPTVVSTVVSTSVPINSPVPSPTSFPTIEISSGETFRDDFDTRLADGWTWIGEDPSKWSLSAVPGWLQMIASDASFDGPDLPPNILLREAPTGDFDVTTSLRFAPRSNFQFAGLVVFQDKGNVLQFGRAYCDVENACVGSGIYFDNIENGSFVGSNYQTAFDGELIYLRLQRRGNTYSGYYSEDGEQWIKTGEHVRDFSQMRIGLLAAQAPTEITAEFDYFAMNSPSTAKTRSDILCRVSADAQSAVSVTIESDTTISMRGISLDNHWLNVQNPEKNEDTCWIPFDPARFNASEIASDFQCADPLGCAQIGPNDPFHFAFWGVLSGADMSLGQDAQRGVEIAIDELGGQLHGHDILLTTQDALCTLKGGEAAARQLASDPSIVALIGSTCSDETVGGIALLTEAGFTTISPSNTRSSLTDENRSPEYAGFLRTAQNDALQSRIVAEFVYNTLSVRRVAIIHDESGYSQALQQVFADHFTQLGGQIVAREEISSDDTDMHTVLTRISDADPELIYYPVFVAAGGYITAQTKDIPGLEAVKLISSDGVFTPDFLLAAGSTAQGMYISSSDFSQFPDAYNAFVEKYRAKYGVPPLSLYHAQAYDAANMIFTALEKIAVVEKDGTIYVPRLALRNAIYATQNFAGITGMLTCSSSGDCGAPAIAIYQVMSADPATWNPQDTISPNPKRVYP